MLRSRILINAVVERPTIIPVIIESENHLIARTCRDLDFTQAPV